MTNRISNPIVFWISIISILIVLLGGNVYPYIMGNFSESAYVDSTRNFEVPGKTLKQSIAKAAGYYLNGYSETLMFLNRVEMSEVGEQDFNEMLAILDRAIDNIENAKDAYSMLNSQLAYQSYDLNAFYSLLYFDYDRFQMEKGLNATVFEKVEKYLRWGDVNGVFSTLLTDTENILNSLYKIKSSVEAGQYPKLENLWRINQQFSEAMLFGQYTSEILYRILSAK